jgi:hypothetical protein
MKMTVRLTAFAGSLGLAATLLFAATANAHTPTAGWVRRRRGA